TGHRPRSLDFLTARSLDFLAARSLDFLTARSLDFLTARSLDFLTTRSLHLLSPRRLNARTPQRLAFRTPHLLPSRSLHFLTTRRLDLLTRASQRARRLDVLPLRHALLGQHLLRLRHLGRARRLRVGHGHEGGEERYAHDRCRRHQLLHRVFLPRVSGCCTEIAAIPIETVRSHLPTVHRTLDVLSDDRLERGVTQVRCHARK